MRPFCPFFKNPHLLTISGNFWPRAIDEQRNPTRRVLYETEPGTRILVHENRPAGESRGDVFLVHGLEGSSASRYMISQAQRLVDDGFTAHRVNIRSCGGTEDLTPTLYHSGLTADLHLLFRRFRDEGHRPLFLVGYSLGGNVALKLAGELGASGEHLADGVAAVSTPVDLHACVQRLARAENWIYEQKFIRSLTARYRRRHHQNPAAFPLDGLERARTIYEFDDRFTAKCFGFGDAPTYYRTQSSLQFIPAIAVPTLLVQAEDDPLIPFELYQRPEIRGQKNVQVLSTQYGGHLGFIARETPRFWLDGVLCEWIEQQILSLRRNKDTQLSV